MGLSGPVICDQNDWPFRSVSRLGSRSGCHQVKRDDKKGAVRWEGGLEGNRELSASAPAVADGSMNFARTIPNLFVEVDIAYIL